MAEVDPKWKRLWEIKELDRCKLPDLKQFLKSVGLPMNGDALNVVKRVQMYLDVKFLDLFVLQDGQKLTPYELKAPQLRRIVAQLGMDPSGDKDELHSSLIDSLKKKKSTSGASGSSSGGGGPSGSSSHGESSTNSGGEPLGIVVAKQILEMATDYQAILSTSGTNITTDSSIASMRKAYLKLSLLIHPDKLEKEFPNATKAFQALVTAYERLSQPELFLEEEEEDDEDEKKKKKKDKKIMRSNDGCHRTSLFCPRCKAEWGLPDSGVEPYDYNFMMMGLKSYNCAGCLFEFGCMTALHKCPFCKKGFEYHPNDFHRKINCGHAAAGCKTQFGFFLFHISDRLEKEYRLEIRKKQERQLKEKEQLQKRAERAKSRQTVGELGQQGKDKLFVLNLLDACPRCGEELESNQELRIGHLHGCNDKGKIAAYAKQLKEEAELGEKKKKLKEKEEEVQNVQSWDYLGAKTSEMWLLTEQQVKIMCEKYQLDPTGTKDELIARLVRHRNGLDSKRMLTEAGEVGSGGGGGPAPPAKKKKLSADDLPTNMESMSIEQLKSVCASLGILTTKKTKDGIINDIEKSVHGAGEPFLLRLTDGKKKK